ncbi:hypothetical protein SODALDRAFT_360527 [Sodiomyces alkalinus F11]|uniref:Uncharacterized protein n=1 Tax=Sodiomyces alkalinus (strain CBS 110278 / VKM F-3762 / F11) TaxID=1314773 RepID=A0A3N2PUN1_SODAK|nr:hypothetical protein SODALDRAFT_360527 [Sodiomyces alkalinus F11]ROT38190.1 hypothetical protein SODALDRAFT_360527 [Sodiomyces alkalinus F11]
MRPDAPVDRIRWGVGVGSRPEGDGRIAADLRAELVMDGIDDVTANISQSCSCVYSHHGDLLKELAKAIIHGIIGKYASRSLAPAWRVCDGTLSAGWRGCIMYGLMLTKDSKYKMHNWQDPSTDAVNTNLRIPSSRSKPLLPIRANPGHQCPQTWYISHAT